MARDGEQAPGTPDGVSFYGPGFEELRLNNAGQIAFRAVLDDSSVPRPNYGIWSEGSGSLALVARQGNQAPGMPSGVNFNSLNFFNSLALNDAGQTAFPATLTGTANNGSIWLDDSGTLTLVARSGDQVPGAPIPVPFLSSRPALNNAGQVAFSTGYTIWSQGSGSLALVARVGDHAPGTPSGVTFHGTITTFGVYPVLNDAGQTGFVANLADSEGVQIGTGIWLERSGSLALVARSGDHAPGTPDGVYFSGVPTSGRPGHLQLNDAGQIAFTATLIENGVGVGEGIWATDRSGALQLIAREGGVLELAPGDFRTIRDFYGSPFTTSTGNSDGRLSLFNNLGQLAFAAIFTDGTSGIFVSNRVAVPEPSTLLLLGFGSLAVLWRRRAR